MRLHCQVIFGERYAGSENRRSVTIPPMLNSQNCFGLLLSDSASY